MKKELTPYYLSRSALALAFGALLYLTGSPVWTAALTAAVLLTLFLLAPRSGRYSVHPEKGVTALRRDEWTQAVNDKAGRNAFVAVLLSVGGAAVYAGVTHAVVVPVQVLEAVLGLGIGVYYVSDLVLRRME